MFIVQRYQLVCFEYHYTTHSATTNPTRTPTDLTSCFPPRGYCGCSNTGSNPHLIGGRDVSNNDTDAGRRTFCYTAPQKRNAPAILSITPSPLPMSLKQGGSLVLCVEALMPWVSKPVVMSTRVVAFGIGLTINVTTRTLAPTAMLRITATSNATIGPHLIQFSPSIDGALLPARR
eukprot:m.114546 g.114546  ORF g.114546 m.114546 type:complete len:176 (-) comp28360_c2_seq2:96-623(-)